MDFGTGGEGALSFISNFAVKLFADGANITEITQLYRDPLIKGFTTNPTLMRKAGIDDYERFAHEVLALVPDRPVSFEVFSDDFADIERQALKIAGWGPNVFVKVPITNTRGESSRILICRLARMGVKLNVTALLTFEQFEQILPAVAECPAAYISIFAGRIADTGRDPVPVMRAAVEAVASMPHIEVIWASPREVLNICQANEIGCHVITATGDILRKLDLLGKDLSQYSLETVKMFRDDAVRAGYLV